MFRYHNILFFFWWGAFGFSKKRLGYIVLNGKTIDVFFLLFPVKLYLFVGAGGHDLYVCHDSRSLTRTQFKGLLTKNLITT